MSGRVSRACDGCRVRKVRCNGAQPCSQCEHLSLKCVFAPPPGKRKPGVRGRLVAQLRESQNGATSTSNSNSNGNGNHVSTASSAISPSNSGGSLSPSSSTPATTSIAGIVSNSATTSPRSTSSTLSSRYTTEYFLSYLQLFEDQVYPVNPVVTPAEIQTAIYNMHSDPEDAALVYAYAAVTINLTQGSWTENGDLAGEMTSLMQLSMAAHRHADALRDSDKGQFGEWHITAKRIMTCIFNEISMMAFQRHDRAFSLLREAITMMQVLNADQILEGDVPTSGAPSPSGGHSPNDILRLKRVYWELYIHERFTSTVAGYPCILPPLRSGIPIGDNSIPKNVDVGFHCLTNLFCVLDGPFLAHWNAQKDPSIQNPEMSAQWIESKQAELDRNEAASLTAHQDLLNAGDPGLSEYQLADLLVTRLWLRTLVWQFALSHGLLRSAPPRSTHDGLSLHFPAQRLSVQLRNLASRIGSVASIVIHGTGILQKLFEITSTVADVLALPLGPGQTQEEFRARLEDFEFLVRFIFSFDKIRREQRNYLREKLGTLQTQYTIIDFADLAKASPDA